MTPEALVRAAAAAFAELQEAKTHLTEAQVVVKKREAELHRLLTTDASNTLHKNSTD